MSYDLSWLWPLLAGALLTAAGSLWREFVAARRRRLDNGREHVLSALNLATRIASEVSAAQAQERFASEPIDYDNALLLKLSEISELIPSAKARSAVNDACFIVNAASAARQLGAWGEPAGNIQRAAMFRLRNVLGAEARGEARLPRDDIAWLASRGEELRAAWDEASAS